MHNGEFCCTVSIKALRYLHAYKRKEVLKKLILHIMQGRLFNLIGTQLCAAEVDHAAWQKMATLARRRKLIASVCRSAAGFSCCDSDVLRGVSHISMEGRS